MKFRKKPIVIEATQLQASAFDNAHPNPEHIIGVLYDPVERCAYIATLEGTMRANIGDWIITGVKDEMYPCKPDIFAMTYEPAAPQAEPIADSDADYWLRHRQAILDAIERAGFVLMSDANRFWLHHKGECDFVEAAAWVYAGWTAAPKAEHAHGITGDSDADR